MDNRLQRLPLMLFLTPIVFLRWVNTFPGRYAMNPCPIMLRKPALLDPSLIHILLGALLGTPKLDLLVGARCVHSSRSGGRLNALAAALRTRLAGELLLRKVRERPLLVARSAQHHGAVVSLYARRATLDSRAAPQLVHAKCRCRLELAAGHATDKSLAGSGGDPCWGGLGDRRSRRLHALEAILALLPPRHAKLITRKLGNGLLVAAGSANEVRDNVPGALNNQRWETGYYTRRFRYAGVDRTTTVGIQ